VRPFCLPKSKSEMCEWSIKNKKVKEKRENFKSNKITHTTSLANLLNGTIKVRALLQV